MAAPKSDPVVAALIKRLPASRDEFITWVRMLALAYGYGDLAIDSAPIADSPEQARPTPPAPLKLVPSAPAPRYTIDLQGYARDPAGNWINPEQVGGHVLFDLRGEKGDLGSIAWADGRTGVLGLQLEISAAA